MVACNDPLELQRSYIQSHNQDSEKQVACEFFNLNCKSKYHVFKFSCHNTESLVEVFLININFECIYCGSAKVTVHVFRKKKLLDSKCGQE